MGWGVIGAGRISHVFAEALALAGGGRIIGVAAHDATRGQNFAHAIGARLFDDAAALLAAPGIDICYVASAVHLHHRDCLAALAAGKAVLCEKPLAATAEEAREIAAAAASAGRFCMEGLWTHFVPSVGAAEAALRAGRLGAPLNLMASFGLPLPPGDNTLLTMPGGGALLDRGCYPISLALRLLGEVCEVAGQAMLLPSGADASAELMLRFRDGHSALIGTSLATCQANDMVIAGPEGRLVLHDPITCPEAMSLTRPGPIGAGGGAPSRLRSVLRQVPGLAALARRRRTERRRFPRRGSGHAWQIEEVHRCLAAGRRESAVVPLALSIATLEVIDRVRQVPPSGR